jgi:predicted branched-subunit amino acid permease
MAHHTIKRMSKHLSTSIWQHPSFANGSREMLGVSLGIGAWGLVTGVAMTKSGLSLPLSLLMSFTVYAGSAQLAALPLIVTGAPIWMIWAIAMCVNLRFVIFSTQWRPYFAHLPRWQRVLQAYFSADLNYVLFMARFPQPRPSPEQIPYFWGGAVTNWSAWQLSTVAGLLLADTIPAEWGLGFAGVLALLALMCSLLSGRASWLAAVVAGTAAVAAVALPMKLNIVVAIAAAVAAGVVMDQMKLRSIKST